MNIEDELDATAFPSPVFEAFALKMTGESQMRKARQLVTEELGKGWRVTRFGDDRRDFEVTHRKPRLSVSDAWAATYRLRARPGVEYAEPVFAAALFHGFGDEEATPVPTADTAINLLCPEPTPLPESADPEWSLKETQVDKAWGSFFPQGSKPGEGIVIGHPDTGYRKHPEIADNLLTDKGFDFVRNDPDPQDELEDGGIRNPGHGTGTASVIVSPRGRASALSTGNGVSGVAPGAKLIPFRVERSVVLVSNLNLARAIEKAATAGAHVISISMGGLFGWRLSQAIAFAQKRGVIILAAAGNCVRFVVWPAAYDEVIAVAASNARRETWQGSCRGGKVDVTAPGESVWHAHVARNSQPGGPDLVAVAQGSGTSYAVATVAGVAALWLAHHGRDKLIQQYGVEKIPFLFNQILRASCTPVQHPSWEPGKFGAGLVDARKVLATPLPDSPSQPVVPPGLVMEEHPPVDKGREDTFVHLFEQSLTAGSASGPTLEVNEPGARLRSKLANLLNTTEANLTARLNEVGQELAFHLAVNPDLYRDFEASLSEAAPGAGGPSLDAAGAEAAGVETTRGALLEQGVSPALTARLAGET